MITSMLVATGKGDIDLHFFLPESPTLESKQELQNASVIIFIKYSTELIRRKEKHLL